ncbi:hypothetical protein [Methylocystis heyeri]|uniref:Uncharacterized protein n=1 Tax=Methylocystis heyeri TaxID=391905 RepID=A0A6B8KIT0_9HYPH|nr:hypothetical protein [Methylocystis heyeri]QGM47577.1 hypothetical protein H2LOC_018870 [Methylocystis heyeri]
MRRITRVAAASLILALGACGEPKEPNDAVGAKVLRNMFERAAVPARIVSFKKTQGRAAHVGTEDVYEYWYESEIQFPDGFDAKCANEKERGACTLLGLAADQSFQKNEILKSEGSLHFSRNDKGWAAEDKNTY